MILDHQTISRRIFFPRSTDAEPSLRVDVGGASLGCHVCRAFVGKAGLLLHFHGNGEVASDYDPWYAKFFHDMGVNVCFAEYRGYGQSTGSPSLTAMLGDGERIVQALGVEPSRLVVMGRSLGSLYAIELAHRIPEIAGLVIESGIADVAENWPLTEERAAIGLSDADFTAAMSTHFDHRRKLTKYEGKLLVLHTQNDQFLDPSHAERLHTWAGGNDKRLVVFPEGNHTTIFAANRAEYARELEAFLRRAGVA